MKTCPKCKHQDNSTEPTACPRCGVIYAKYEDANRTKTIEDRLSQQLERTLRIEEEISSQYTFTDKENEIDQESYPVVQGLTTFFNMLAIVTAVAWLVGTIPAWSYIKAIPFITPSDRYALIVIYLLSAPLPIATYLAFGWALKLGKDIADNTRATRHYMSQLAQKRKTRT